MLGFSTNGSTRVVMSLSILSNATKVGKFSNFEVESILPMDIWSIIASFASLSTLFKMRMCCSSMKILTNAYYERAVVVRVCMEKNFELQQRIKHPREHVRCATCHMGLPPVGYDTLTVACPFPYCRAVTHLPPAPPIVEYSLNDVYNAKAGRLYFKLLPIADDDDQLAYIVQRRDYTTSGEFVTSSTFLSPGRILRRHSHYTEPIQLKVRARTRMGCETNWCVDRGCCTWTPWSEPSVPFLPPNETEVDLMQ